MNNITTTTVSGDLGSSAIVECTILVVQQNSFFRLLDLMELLKSGPERCSPITGRIFDITVKLWLENFFRHIESNKSKNLHVGVSG